MSDFKWNKSNQITPNKKNIPASVREKSKQPVPIHKETGPTIYEKDFEKRVFGILSEKFITPFQEQFDIYQKNISM